MGRPREISAEERAELLRQGYRPIEIWVPDVTNAEYRKEAERQSRAMVEADRQAEVVELIDEDPTESWDRS